MPEVHTVDPQRSLGAIVDKSMIDEAIKPLPISLSPSTQDVYCGNWKFWRVYCKRMGISPWLGAQGEDWGAELLSYLTWGHTVMKIGGSALTARFDAVKFLHLVEGKGDFDMKAHRVRALLEATRRKGETNQNSP